MAWASFFFLDRTSLVYTITLLLLRNIKIQVVKSLLCNCIQMQEKRGLLPIYHNVQKFDEKKLLQFLSLWKQRFFTFFSEQLKKYFEIDFLFKEFLSFFEVRRVDSGLSSNTSMRATTIAVKLDIFMGTSCNFEWKM